MRWIGIYLFLSISAFGAEKRIVVLGDSLTEGFGVAKEQSFPALLEEKFRGTKLEGWKVINAGVSGSTTASATPRLKWILKQKPEAVILALGGNDGLRGLDPKAAKENLRSAIRLARREKVRVILAGMEMPPNYGKEYRAEFRTVFRDLAKEEKVDFLPFLLEGVGGNPKMNLDDGIHPNEAGHRVLADTLFRFLREKL